MGTSKFELGLIISILSFTSIVTKIPLGILSEKVGKWPIIPISLICQAIVFFLYSLVLTPIWIYPIRILHALILAAFHPVNISIVADLSPPSKRGEMMGLFLTCFGLAMMIGPFLSSILLNYVNFRHLFRLAAIIPLTTCIILLLAKYRADYIFTPIQKPLSKERKPSLLQSLKKIVYSRNILIISYLRSIFAFTNAFLITFLAIHASENLFLSSSLIAILFGIRGVTNTMFRFPSGRLSDRIGYRIPLIFSFLLLSSSFLMFSETKSTYNLAMAMAIYGIGHAIRAVAEWALLANSTPPAISATASAYLSTMFNIGEALGAVVAGILAMTLPITSIFILAMFILLSGPFIAILINQDFQRY